jgi:hypothetical protein
MLFAHEMSLDSIMARFKKPPQIGLTELRHKKEIKQCPDMIMGRSGSIVQQQKVVYTNTICTWIMGKQKQNRSA